MRCVAGKTQFTPQEQQGYDLFRGKARCNDCHRDGGPGEDPLFTDFTAANIGTPANPRLPFYAENQPDALGYAANPAGSALSIPGWAGSWRSAACSAIHHRGCSLAQAGAGQFRPIPGADTAQCRQAAVSRICEILRPQRVFYEPQGDRAFLQHARRAAALQTARSRRGHAVLAGAGEHAEYQHEARSAICT